MEREIGGSGREQNATIVFRSWARLKRSEPFLAKRRSYRHSRRRRNRACTVRCRRFYPYPPVARVIV
jgi:hypothetical protein